MTPAACMVRGKTNTVQSVDTKLSNSNSNNTSAVKQVLRLHCFSTLQVSEIIIIIIEIIISR